DLVAMSREHDARLAVRIADGNHIAMAVGADVIGVLIGPLADHILDRPFEAGRTWGMKQFLEERQRFFLHGLPRLNVYEGEQLCPTSYHTSASRREELPSSYPRHLN